MNQAEEILEFWIGAGPKRWFRGNPDFDGKVSRRFKKLHLETAQGDRQAWQAGARGMLALLLLLDQFPRNIYRGTAHAFATDPLARAAAEEALGNSLDLDIDLELQPFFYLPFEHSEDLSSQAEAVKLFEAYVKRGGDESYFRYAILHAEIIERFGRFPHRNIVLGRKSTSDELAYLAAGGFKG